MFTVYVMSGPQSDMTGFERVTNYQRASHLSLKECDFADNFSVFFIN
jgi:hypothetical protein